MANLLRSVGEIQNAAEHLKTCLENGAFEDAYQWTLAILEGLHSQALREVARLHGGLDELRRRTGPGPGRD